MFLSHFPKYFMAKMYYDAVFINRRDIYMNTLEISFVLIQKFVLTELKGSTVCFTISFIWGFTVITDF